MASKRAKRRKLRRIMCEGKNWYETKEKAERANRKYHKKHGGKWMHAYKCKFCPYWHLGHVSKIDYSRRKHNFFNIF